MAPGAGAAERRQRGGAAPASGDAVSGLLRVRSLALSDSSLCVWGAVAGALGWSLVPVWYLMPCAAERCFALACG